MDSTPIDEDAAADGNRQARAAAYQAIGISTAEFHRSFTPRMNRLATDSEYPDAVKRRTREDSETMLQAQAVLKRNGGPAATGSREAIVARNDSVTLPMQWEEAIGSIVVT